MTQDELRHYWEESGGNDLLKGQTFQELFDLLPDKSLFFTLKDCYLRCIDEGTVGGIHLAGSGVLYHGVLADFKGRATGVYSHEGCGAVKLYCEKNHLPTTHIDYLAEEKAQKIALSLGVPYLGMIKANDMRRPVNLHTARVVYYDGTGKLDLSRSLGLPPGFVISRRLISDVAYAISEVEVALEIAFGHHGFGSLLNDNSPFYLVAVTSHEQESLTQETLLDELNEIAQKHPIVAVDTIKG